MKKLQAERGERLGGRPPYGYRKKDSDSKEIVPDEETAPIVKHIFSLCASGKGPGQIARILTEEKVLTPSNYYYRKTGKSHEKLDTTRPYSWSNCSVAAILDSKVYLGHTVGLRTTSLSYKLELSSQVQQMGEIKEDLKGSPETKTFAGAVVEFVKDSLDLFIGNF